MEAEIRLRTAQLEERATQLQAWADTLILTEERERTRISRMVHDQLQQLLVAALLNFRMLYTKDTRQGMAEDFKNLESILKDAIQMTHTLTAEISPAVLHQCGLSRAIRWLHIWCMEKYGLEVEVNAEDDIDLGMAANVNLFFCVRELLANIVQHSGVKSATLRMWRARDDDMIRIEVSDHGSGFDPVSSEASKNTRSGRGLFNSHQRLKLLGGGMEIESRPGAGSCFTLWVPLGAESSFHASPIQSRTDSKLSGNASTPEPPPPPATAPTKIRIILADDHPIVRKGLLRVFQNEPDFEVMGQACDGHEAIRLSRELLPDFVIMDVNMPLMDGIEATGVIRKELPRVRVLGLSTYTDEEHRSAMMQAGAEDLLHKNTSLSLLVTTIRNLATCRMSLP